MKAIASTWLLILLHSGQAQAQSSTPDARVRVAEEVVRVLDGGDFEAMRRLVAERYEPAYRDEWTADYLVGDLARIAEWTGGLSVIGTSSDSLGVTLRVREARTGWTAPLRVTLERASPHRVTGLGYGVATPDSSAETGSQRALLDHTAALVDSLCAGDVFSGAVLLARGTEVLYQHACGEANKDYGVPNTIDTRFNLASMNKMFTAVGIALLVQQGRLAYGDTVAEHVPDFPTPEGARQMRVEHLLTHTNGLPSYFTDEWEDASRTRFRSVDDYLALVRGQPLHFPPGSRTSYSNTGFLLLGKIIEAVTGQSYFDYIAEHVFEPAGMIRSCYCDLDRMNEDLAVGYKKEYTADGTRYLNNLYADVIRGGPAGGGYATIGDLHRFAIAMENGALVTPETARLLTTPKTDLHADLTAYGYGFIARRGGLSFGHNGGGTGVSSEMEHFRDRGYTIVVLSNYGAIGGELTQRLRTLVLQTPVAR